MGFRNTGIRAALILGLALAVTIGVAAFAQQPIRFDRGVHLPSFTTAVLVGPVVHALQRAEFGR
jgi:hypothetical protein